MRKDHIVSWLSSADELQLDDALQALTQSPTVEPFEEDRVQFVSELSRVIARKAPRSPELQALAFWMRRSELVRMRRALEEATASGQVLMPRGTVFHIPPSNVDTMFVYSWMLALLMGNRNIVRLSSRETEQSHVILQSLAEVVASYPEIATSSLVVSYGHDERVTSALSLVADVRVIWGGDATVDRIRQIAIRPDAKDVTFPDRASLCAISTDAYLQQTSEERDEVVRKFFNDAFWFDQLGCSSPRTVAWIGHDQNRAATDDFWTRLAEHVQQRGYSVEASTAIAKLTHLYGASIDMERAQLTWLGNEIAFVDVSDIPSIESFCGAGTFYQSHVSSLLDLIPTIRRRHQTLTTFGIGRDEVLAFVHALCGKGIDRIVPVGEALAFDRTWDGMDLLQEFSRRVTTKFGAEVATK